MNSVSVSKPDDKRRKRFDEAAAEHAIAGQQVGDAAAERPGDERGQQDVAQAVAGAVGVAVCCRSGRR